jgi:hypothetical protein
MNRREILYLGAAIAAMSFVVLSAHAQDDTDDELLTYRGFAVDVTAVANDPDIADIEHSIKHQIDIVAECGAKPEVLDFFRGRRIVLQYIKGDEPGRFGPNKGVQIDATPQPPEKPILLHELLHAFHFWVLPDGFENADVLRFYNIARERRRYPSRGRDGYVLSNAKEFFAVTASIYLWGVAERAPFTREHLKAKQPKYYAWLGEQFGVVK